MGGAGAGGGPLACVRGAGAGGVSGVRRYSTPPRPSRGWGGKSVEIKQSHGGSGQQSRSVIDGLEADVVTLALAYDVDDLHAHGDLVAGRLAEAAAAEQRALHLDHRVPGAQGQSERHQGLGRSDQTRRQRHHAESEDLRRRALELSRGVGLCGEEGRRRCARAKAFVAQLFKNVPVLDTGARGSTTTFVERGIGDVLLAWENEALPRATNSARTSSRSSCLRSAFWPSRRSRSSTRSSTKNGTRAAEAYLEFLYTPEGQELAAKHDYRPRDAATAAKYAARFPPLPLFTVDAAFGGWQKAQATHFADGGTFDQIYTPGK